MTNTETRAAQDSILHDILDSACPNGGTGDDGWDTYIIETHCVAWRVTAKKVDGWWRIRNVTSEAC